MASPLIYVLLFALVVDVVGWAGEGGRGVPLDAVAIAVILILNAGLGAVQERKAESALARLAALAAPQVWAMRGGVLVRVPSRDVVTGDLLRVEAGDRVAADGTVSRAERLAVDESVVTGESLPVDKDEGGAVLAGTLVVRGTGYLTVTTTGPASTMGRLAAMLERVEAERTPLERRLDAFGRRMAVWVLVLAAVIAGLGLLVEGLDQFARVFLFAVALAVAAVPEGLPAVLTVTLTLGVERMARRRAVVRRLAAVEALGSVTVIATDKTGTLTANRLEVHSLDSPHPGRAVVAMTVANDAELAVGAGDPLELALLRFAAQEGAAPAALRLARPRELVRPFDPAWRYMRVTVREGGRSVSYLKGAPEAILDRCRLDSAERAEIDGLVATRAAAGYRLLGLAAGEGDREDDLVWLGLVSFWDPPRPEVPAAVAEARAAGIRVAMVTGDHPATAVTIAARVGIATNRVVTGDDLDRMDDAALSDAVVDTPIFARVRPEHKLRIVSALQARGEVVAMTGDGVNDAPALKRSDVGVAMGERGSDVSREVADLVLLDDNFATIVAAIEEGRGIYENIRKFIRFLLSTNLSEVLVVTIGAFAAFGLGLRDADGGILLPLTAAQLLWINLVTDGAPALALGLDRNPGVMARPPRDPKEPLLDSTSRRFVVLSGAFKATVALALLWLLPRLVDPSLEATRTAVFLFLAAGQLFFAYPARHTDIRSPANPAVHLAVAGGLAVQAALLSVPALMVAVGTVPLTGAALGWVGASVLAAWAAAETISWSLWRRARE